MRKRKTAVRSERSIEQKRPVEQDEIKRASKYNYVNMRDETIQVHQGFSKRLSSIRAAKKLSAREMSLSLGQGAGYINNIENGNNLPSMSMFFEICEYLEITPKEFFDYPSLRAGKTAQMLTIFEQLGGEEQDLMIKLAERLKTD